MPSRKEQLLNIIGKVIDELYRYFEILNKDYYEGKLPDPVITIQKSRQNNLGHFTLGKVWKNREEADNEELAKYEININPVNLNRPVEEIVGTVHHEMVHYANKISEINDCNGQVHNKKFKELAESVGLICEKSKKYGWGITELSDTFREYINESIKPDSSAFDYFRSVEKKESKPREKKTFKYICPQCGIDVKGKPYVEIKCGKCDVLMEMEE